MAVDRGRPGTAVRRGGLKAAAVVLLAAFSADAQEVPSAPEYRIKAAFLYNFTLYTEWPATSFAKADSPIVLAVVGDDPFGDELETAVRGKTVRGRPIEVRRYGQPEDVQPCHILFFSNSLAKHAPQLLRKFAHVPSLTVGESDDFTRSGGVIRFFVDENKIRFEVNTDAAQRARLKLSSKLLHLARIVRESEPKER